MTPLLHRLSGIAALCVLVVTTGAANAHPHIWVTMTSDLVYAPDGAITGIRHHWTFDDMYSAFATQGIEGKTKGEFTRAELAPLAQENVSSLKDFDYFTFVKNNGRKIELKGPVDYFLDYDPKATVLTLHFTLPLKTPLHTKVANIDVYDPEYFIDFEYAKSHPVTLVGAPAACKLSVVRPADTAAKGQQLSEEFFNSLTTAADWGAQFANKITVNCP
jgi:ABC-type uncharacterized transport system substrate-binding protein